MENCESKKNYKSLENIDHMESFIQNLREEIEEEGEESKKRLYTMMLEKSENILNKLSNDKYDLAFIGQKGTGKTTAISHLFNLVREYKGKENGKNVEKTEEILETGSGGTTISDVVIKQSDKEYSYIEIEFLSNGEVESILEDFCYMIISKLEDININIDEIHIPSEIIRAIRNMIKLKDSTNEDQALSLAKQYINKENTVEEGIEKFINKTKQLANLDDRTENIHVYSTELTKNSEIEWIKKTFRNINLVNLDSISVPRKVILNVSKNIFDFEDIPMVNSIIDTRGLDSQKSFERADIENYIKYADNTICIFTDLFPPAPSEPIFNLMTNFLDNNDPNYLKTKIVLMILHREEEAKKVLSYDGTVNSEEQGLEVRKTDILNSVNNAKIEFLENNILFYNGLKNYEKNRIKLSLDEIDKVMDGEVSKEELIDSKKEDIRKYRSESLEKLCNVIENRKKYLTREINEIYSNFMTTKFDFENDKYANELTERLKYDLENLICGDGKIKFEKDLINRYIEYLYLVHASTINSMNKGYISGWDDRIINIAKNIIKEIFKDAFNERRDIIKGKIEAMKKLRNITSAKEIFLNSLSYEVNYRYDKVLDSLPEVYGKLLDDEILNIKHSEFWDEVKYRWGRGSGYRNYVLGKYRNRVNMGFEETREDISVNDIIISHWNEYLKEIINKC